MIYDYEFPPTSTGLILSVDGVYIRSGVEVQDGDVLKDPTIVDSGTGIVSVGLNLTKPGCAPSANVAILVGVNNPTDITISEISIDWGDSIVESHRIGYGVAHPLDKVFSHRYSIPEPTIHVTAKAVNGSTIDTTSMTVTGLPLSSDFDVDQIRVLRFNSGVELDWTSVSDVPNPISILSRYDRSYFAISARSLDKNRNPDVEIIRSSWVASQTGLYLSVVRYPKTVEAGIPIRPKITVYSFDDSGLASPSNGDVSLSVISDDTVYYSATGSMRDGEVSFDISIGTTGTFVLSASSPGFTSGTSGPIRVI